ncbi:MAG: Bug family tripartite tricarboxylate transporter substrate binding protein [Hyphomicrobiaceae bacterium]
MKSRYRVLAAAVALSAGPAAAQDFPTKPVEMTVLFGSTAQTIGQVLADQMSKNLPQPVVPVSRTGGGGAIGYTYVHSTKPDGYNIVWNSNSISTTFHGGRVKFDYKAFTPIARVSLEVPAVAVRTDSGWKTVADMAKAVKASKEKIKVGASGKGSFTHLTTVALFKRLGIADHVIYVPYDAGKAPVELLGKRVDVAVQWPGQFIPHAKAGTLRILCVTSKQRVSQIKDVPTCDQSGAKGLDLTMWRGLAAPAGTPKAAVDKIMAATRQAVQSKEFQDAAKKIGFEAAYLPAAEFGKVIARDDKEIAGMMSDLGLKKTK